MNDKNHLLKSFRVRVGHWEVRVRARDAQGAVDCARRQLAQELPRLYDIIQTLTSTRFLVDAAA